MKSQKDAFVNYEADSWYERNKNFIDNYSPEKDPVIDLVKKYSISPSSILEIGCSAGYRLNALGEIYNKSTLFGIEPSKKAVSVGRNSYQKINFFNSTAEDLSSIPDNSIDLLIVGFILYVVDRKYLLKIFSEIDRVLVEKGKVIIIDFYAEKCIKNHYEHIDEFQAWSFKQKYHEILVSTKMYQLIDKTTYNHTTKKLDASFDY